MSVKELITVPDDILRKKSEPLYKVDVNEKKLIKENNIENLKLYCEDFRSVKFKNKFDYIIFR